MTTNILSSREFNKALGKAKKAVLQGPVFITDRGRVKYVFLSMETYHNITSKQTNIADLLAMREPGDIEFHTPKLNFTAKPM